MERQSADRATRLAYEGDGTPEGYLRMSAGVSGCGETHPEENEGCLKDSQRILKGFSKDSQGVQKGEYQ